MEWKKISENHPSDKGLIGRTYKELLPFNNNKINNWAIRREGKRLE